jgi:hypothetical protein
MESCLSLKREQIPVTSVSALCKALIVLVCSNTGVVGSNPARG